VQRRGGGLHGDQKRAQAIHQDKRKERVGVKSIHPAIVPLNMRSASQREKKKEKKEINMTNQQGLYM
jgi:hypothetical protein